MSCDDLAKAVQRLEELFGKSSQNTLGAAVFQSDAAVSPDGLDEISKSKYQYFAGDAWESLGQDNWLKTWARLYRRPAGDQGAILSELKELNDPATALAASQLTENHDDPQGQRKPSRACSTPLKSGTCRSIELATPKPSQASYCPAS